ALGRGLDACLGGLRQGLRSTVPMELSGYSEAVRMPYYALAGEGGDLFDPGRFLRLIPEAAAEALGQAGLSAAEQGRMIVCVGSTAFGVSRAEGEYLALLAKEPGAAFALPRVGFGEITDRLREAFGLGGRDYAFNTACTASANALLAAQRLISLGRAEHALVLGLELANRTTITGFSGLQLLSQELKPFDADRDGIVLGEGLGAVVLSAQPGGLGLCLAGGASNSDTFSVTTANPDGSSIAALQRVVLERAGLRTGGLRAIKVHGTASPMNDSGEAAGLRQVFDPMPPLVALKPYLGHTLGACGTIELALLGACLSRGFLPATLGFSRPDPALGVVPSTVQLPAGPGHYLCNYFGFGGSNTALLLEKTA
ncbi:MAG TPA: beta-ketoacyl synthase N-terminal-like domain-containing protein, partial [bacterium]|nr:beta-ketoacyl synthase N-terminal-like domain-containing protein [bacterium]